MKLFLQLALASINSHPFTKWISNEIIILSYAQILLSKKKKANATHSFSDSTAHPWPNHSSVVTPKTPTK